MAEPTTTASPTPVSSPEEIARLRNYLQEQERLAAEAAAKVAKVVNPHELPTGNLSRTERLHLEGILNDFHRRLNKLEGKEDEAASGG